VNIAIDIGNTRTKVGVFNGRRLECYFIMDGKPGERHFEDWQKSYAADHIIISSVKTLDDTFRNTAEKPASYMFLSATTPVPISVLYHSRETLGQDRLCGAVAAASRFPGQNALVIDAGTCITYDIVDSERQYHGGAISPGLQMRLNGMHRFTDKLPQLTFSGKLDNIGMSTASSMELGAGLGAALEVTGFITHFNALFPDLKVILTGGDHPFFEQRIENPIFAAPNLILEGLNEILLFNKQSE